MSHKKNKGKSQIKGIAQEIYDESIQHSSNNMSANKQNMNKKRLLRRNDDIDDEIRPIMKASIQKYQESDEEDNEHFNNFEMVDEAKQKQGQITNYLCKDGVKKQAPKKEKKIIIIEAEIATFIEEKKKNDLGWGSLSSEEEQEQPEINFSSLETVLRTNLHNFTQEIKVNKESENKQEYTQTINRMEEEKKNDSNGKLINQINGGIQNPTTINQKPLRTTDFHVQITNDTIITKTQKNVVQKPLSDITIFILGTFRICDKQQLISLLSDLGAKILGPTQSRLLKLTNPWLISGEKAQETSHYKDISNIKNLTIFTEDTLNIELQIRTNKDIPALLNEQCSQNQTKTQPQPIESIKTQQIQVKQDPFFGRDIREIQNTEKQIEVMKLIKQIDNKKKVVIPDNVPSFLDTSVPIPKKCSGSQLWTEKYKPTSFSDCISNDQVVRQLMTWLQSWGQAVDQVPKYQSNNFKGQNVKAKAALLSGPPGIGKTTSVRVVAKHLGYHLLEWNASDVRSKLAIEEGVSHLKNNTIIGEVSSLNTKTLILMDEVDGMSGSDKGGTMALIAMIKDTRVPIVCICNDRYNPKIKSLSGHCLDLQFKKPNETDVLKLLIRICQSESIPFDEHVLRKKIQESQCDIRQLVNMLQVTRIQNKMSDIQKIGTKDSSVLINIFDATKILLTYDAKSKVVDLLSMYFTDHSIIPLLYQENYLYKSRDIEHIAKAANSLAEADILSRRVRKNNDWSLMPQVGFLSTIYPTQQLKGTTDHKIEFTQHLGKLSSVRKQERLLVELKDALSPVSYNMGGQSIKYGYIQTLSNCINQMIGKAEYDNAVHLLKSHNLTLTLATENMMDLLSYFPKRNPLKQIDSLQKTKLTVAFKQTADSLEQGGGKKKQATNSTSDFGGSKMNPNIEEEESQEQQEVDEQQEKDQATQKNDVKQVKHKKKQAKKGKNK